MPGSSHGLNARTAASEFKLSIETGSMVENTKLNVAAMDNNTSESMPSQLNAVHILNVPMNIPFSLFVSNSIRQRQPSCVWLPC